jgi:hypothetical protein
MESLSKDHTGSYYSPASGGKGDSDKYQEILKVANFCPRPSSFTAACSAGLPAGCRVDLPVHAALYTNRKKP